MLDAFKSLNLASIASNGMLLIGHASFLLTFLSYSQKSLIRLRMVAVASLVFGLVYNSWIDVNMPPGQDIHLVVFWLTVFLIQNVYLLVQQIKEGLEVPLSADQRDLLTIAFPAMHSRDWVKMVEAATKREFRQGDEILALGAPTSALQVICSGVAQEVRNGVSKQCQKGVLWGELTYVMGADYYNSSPVSIVVSSDRLTLLEWPYETLRKMGLANERFNAALQNGFVHSAGLKHGLLAST